MLHSFAFLCGAGLPQIVSACQRPPISMHCHLLIPDLLPPDGNFRAALAGLELPALARLLGRGRIERMPAMAPEDWLMGYFGLPEAAPAPLRLLGEDGAPEVAGAWLCADPVHLRFTTQGLMLGDATGLDLTMDEARAMVAGLNAEFADLGEFRAGSPERWYLKPAREVQATLQPIAEVIGRRVDTYLPDGPDGALWRRHFNEIQVFLHHHPANVAREEAGKPVVNSVWFWGQGALPPAPAKAPISTLLADDPLAKGLARLTGLSRRPAGDTLLFPDSGDALAVSNAARSHALYEEHEGWRATLIDLDRNWLAPALAALKAGRIATLRLSAPGDKATLEAALTRGELMKFWRRPLPLGDLPITDTQA